MWKHNRQYLSEPVAFANLNFFLHRNRLLFRNSVTIPKLSHYAIHDSRRRGSPQFLLPHQRRESVLRLCTKQLPT